MGYSRGTVGVCISITSLTNARYHGRLIGSTIPINFNYDLEIGIYIDVYMWCFSFRYLGNIFLIFLGIKRENLIIGVDIDTHSIELTLCYYMIINLVCSYSISLLNIHFASERMLSDITGKYGNVEQL